MHIAVRYVLLLQRPVVEIACRVGCMKCFQLYVSMRAWGGFLCAEEVAAPHKKQGINNPYQHTFSSKVIASKYHDPRISRWLLIEAPSISPCHSHAARHTQESFLLVLSIIYLANPRNIGDLGINTCFARLSGFHPTPFCRFLLLMASK